ncbi:MAG: hypothetical protein OIN86_14055 [Candidatus Methanoperedens sp.]|nr:hypothetical protein [Candidatus Methanoperedens sp.]
MPCLLCLISLREETLMSLAFIKSPCGAPLCPHNRPGLRPQHCDAPEINLFEARRCFSEKKEP